ncbi:MAG TPA: hypothetical protein VFF74_11570, partial [Methylophilaceae bacterium]|nr:hypothetical protein [Methylophilaceae bacterium]
MPALARAFGCLVLMLYGLGPVTSARANQVLVLSEDETAVFANEPPQVRALLEQAVISERSQQGWQGEWKAAGLYCEASRLGSAEAQYRLGMLYAFGKGVSKDRGLGASLFEVAASQGHFEAQKMLETINFTTTQLPQCVLEAVLPEKGSFSLAIAENGAGGIDTYIAALPQNKRWIVDLVGTLAE